jgi:dTDP-4-dehydrorhamnose reductase
VCRQALGSGERVLGTYRRAAGPVEGVEWRPLDVRDRTAVRALVVRLRPRAVVSTAHV